jgi:hypothetical protein
MIAQRYFIRSKNKERERERRNDRKNMKKQERIINTSAFITFSSAQ